MAIEYFKGQSMMNEFSLNQNAKYEFCPFNLYVILDLWIQVQRYINQVRGSYGLNATQGSHAYHIITKLLAVGLNSKVGTVSVTHRKSEYLQN